MQADWQTTTTVHDERQAQFTREAENYRMSREAPNENSARLRTALGRQLVKLGESLQTQQDQPVGQQARPGYQP